jgi:hypothetical protein
VLLIVHVLRHFFETQEATRVAMAAKERRAGREKEGLREIAE